MIRERHEWIDEIDVIPYGAPMAMAPLAHAQALALTEDLKPKKQNHVQQYAPTNLPGTPMEYPSSVDISV